MKDEIEKSLREIGGDRLVRQWQTTYDLTPVKRLPTAYLDKLALGYAVALGAIAASIDLVMDQAFRDEMEKTHRFLDPDVEPKAQQKLEDTVTEWLKKNKKLPNTDELRRLFEEAGIEIKPETPLPKTAIDCYQWLNNVLRLKSPFKLCGSNHRILNHADADTVIGMLMRGEVGIGDLVAKVYPTMTLGEAREFYKLHIAADRHTIRSLPLKIMSWLWEQGVRSQNPDTVGAPNFLFDLLQKHAPNIDWKRWIEAFFGDKGVVDAKTGKPIEWPKGMSIGDVMFRLYDKGLLNERVFWTSNLGAAVGGMKRRIVIAATMEAGVEVFALIEGVTSGFVNWNDGHSQFGAAYVEWRDQPKYLNMRTLAQATAVAGPAVRALWTGDALSQNLPSLAMTMKHLWVAADVSRRHTDRLVTFSKKDSTDAIEEFKNATGISIRPTMTVIEGGKSMAYSLNQRLYSIGCDSTRVHVLTSRYADEMESIVARIEKLAAIAQGDDAREEAFDNICVTWYLSDTTDDPEALNQLKADIARLEKKLG